MGAMSKSPPHLDWRIVRELPGGDFRVFDVTLHEAEHPVTGRVRTFSVIRTLDWVNVLALTPDDEVVLVRQFRHGTRSQTLEIPGGSIEPGEAPAIAAARELREETGYEAGRWLELGVVEPNPAIQGNRCFTWLALDARPTAAVEPDDGEVIAVELHPLQSLPALVRGGAISHALVVCAFYHLLEHAGGWKRPDPA